MSGMPHQRARDLVSLVEEHIPDPDRFAVSLCSCDGGATFGLCIEDHRRRRVSIVEQESEACQLVLMLQAVNMVAPPAWST